ncbi:MAG: hypothetical protein ACI3T9_02870 [Romboutsia timonensis]
MKEIIITINNNEEFKCVLESIEEHYKEVRWVTGVKPSEFSFDINGEPISLIINSDERIMWDSKRNPLDDEENEDLRGFAYYTFDDFIETFVNNPRVYKKRGFEVVDDKFRRYPDANIQLPVRGDKRSAGYDIRIPERVIIRPNVKVVIPTDIKAFMQDDEVLELYVRSSIGIKKGIVLSNSTGIIDSSFYGNADNDGNISLALWNTNNIDVVLEAGERVCQGIFKKYLIAGDDNYLNEERIGGIGSTGWE